MPDEIKLDEIKFGELKAPERLRYMLVDAGTGLPTLNAILDDVQVLCDKKYSAAVIFVNINSVVNIEQIYGFKEYDALLSGVAGRLNAMNGKLLRKNDIVSVMFPRSDHFVIILSAPRNNARLEAENVEKISSRIMERLSEDLESYGRIQPEYIKFNCGFALIGDNPMIRPQRALFRAVHEAEVNSINAELRDRQKTKEDLRRIITRQEIRTVFQPIVNISDFSIVGYEALTRGPQTTRYEAPMVLFSLADDHGFSNELEWVCIVKSIVNFNLNLNFMKKARAAGEPDNDLLLFINTDPRTFSDEELVIGKFSELVEKYYISPKNIVLEITERTAIEDFSKFRVIVSKLKEMGFSFAIDDAGAGYSSLQSIAELKPKFLKFDMALVRGIDKDFIKQELLRTLMDFARKTCSVVIAEGIETEAEYATIKSLGAHLGQGYYFAKPSPQFVETLQFF